MGIESLISGVTNKLYNSNVVKAVSGVDYISTVYGQDFVPEYTNLEGQKKYQTKAPIPNLPKPETMFFVYFSLNPNIQTLINQKKSLIEYLTRLSAQQSSTDASESYQNSVSESKNKGFFDTISDSISDTISSVSNSLSNLKKGVTDAVSGALGLNADVDAETNADYLPDKFLLKQLSFELSKFVKTVSKPKIDIEVKQFNEYNRPRLVNEKLSYGDLNISFYDVKENPVQQFFFAYLKVINDTFLCKDYNDYNKEILLHKFDTDPTHWGWNLDSYFNFIDKISVIEMYMDKMMVYTYMNPKITSIDFGTGKIGSWAPNEINITFKFEGITNDLLDVEPYTTTFGSEESKSYLKAMINSSITGNMATFLNKRYKEGVQFTVENAVSFIKGILDAPSEERWDKFKSQLLDTARKLGFADETNFVLQVQKTIENYNESEDKGKYILKVVDDPSSIIGKITNTTNISMDSVLSLF
jgi:hypothetical protein|uniref:Baseplate wedge protein n=1 Tax=Myoviridae sp. ctWb16 TaxID=2827690 RepID=A0A8S5T0S9_9CAUD|nr:MAG TPA: baseplate wedge protein [Myoviridae sp. ctWb16]